MKEIDKWKVTPKSGSFKGYIIDRRIFLVLSLIVVSISICAVFRYGLEEKLYINCPADTTGKCYNPCYKMGDRCGIYDKIEYLEPGTTVGKPPDWFFNSYPIIALSLLFIAFITNHLIYNREFDGGEL
jgi:hypothetical protein